jgi:hypothetical protein
MTYPVGHRSHDHGGGDHEQHGQGSDGTGIASKRGRRRSDRGVEYQQRQQPE